MPVFERKRRYPQRKLDRPRVKNEPVPLLPILQHQLQPYTLPFSITEIEQEQQDIFEHKHRVICQLLGYLPLTDPGNIVPKGQYIPSEEKKRQLAAATNDKKELLMAKWGMDQPKSSKELRRVKEQLRTGRVLFSFVKSVRHDNPRSLALAQIAATSIKTEDTAEETKTVVKDKQTLRNELKERDELRRQRDASRKVKKRKDVLQRVADQKKERRAAIIAAAVPDLVKRDVLGVEKATVVAPDDTKQHGERKQKTKVEQHIAAPQFVFNIDQENKSLTSKEKKKKPTIVELKEQLKQELEKRKMVQALKDSKQSSLAKEVINSHNWAQAERKLQGEKVSSIGNLNRDIRRAELKQQSKGKKVKEQMGRQKQEKHKKMVKRQQNLRTHRVARLAKKMKGFAKKGHIVPGFM